MIASRVVRSAWNYYGHNNHTCQAAVSFHNTTFSKQVKLWSSANDVGCFGSVKFNKNGPMFAFNLSWYSTESHSFHIKGKLPEFPNHILKRVKMKRPITETFNFAQDLLQPLVEEQVSPLHVRVAYVYVFIFFWSI